MKTNKSRASLKDIGGLRGKDYLGAYLERVTNDVKIRQHEVHAYQAGIDPQAGSKLNKSSTGYTLPTSPTHQTLTLPV